MTSDPARWRRRVATFVALLALVAVGCTTSPDECPDEGGCARAPATMPAPDVPVREPDVIGVVQSVDDIVLTEICEDIVAEGSDGNGCGPPIDHRLPALALRSPSGGRIEVHGADDPKVLRHANGAYADAEFGDIRVGDTVEVWLAPGNSQPRAAAAVVFTRGG